MKLQGVTAIKGLWDRLSPWPGGKALFGTAIGRAIPYTGTVRPQVRVLSHRYAEVAMADRRAVRNHLECIHAIALANLAEFTGNLALVYTMPDDARFIVSGMRIDYLKKARGTIVAHCDCPDIPSSARTEYEVPVTLRDPDGAVCVEAVLQTLVGPTAKSDTPAG